MKYILTIVMAGVFMLLFSCAGAYAPQLSGSLNDDLQKVLDNHVVIGHRVGLGFSYYSSETGTVSLTSGYRDSQKTSLLETDDIYEIGSITKLFIAAVIFQHIEEGRLSLGDTLDEYGFHFEGSPEISIEQLLGHTSGLPDYFSDPELLAEDGDYTKDRTEQELLDITLALSREEKDWHYSNTNYVLLGMLIQSITGNTAEAEVRRRILEPLNMKRTFFRGKEEIRGDIVRGYYYDRGYWDAWDGVNPLLFSYAGAMVTSMDDMMTFLRALFEGEVVSEESLNRMRQFMPANGRFEYGLGMMNMELLGRRTIGHGGTTLGTIAYAFYAPESGEYFVYFTNLFNDTKLRSLENSLQEVLDWHRYGMGK